MILLFSCNCSGECSLVWVSKRFFLILLLLLTHTVTMQYLQLQQSVVCVSKPPSAIFLYLNTCFYFFFLSYLHLNKYFYTGSNCSSRVLSGCPNPHQPFSLVLTIRHTPTNHHPNIHQILTQHFITFLHESFFFKFIYFSWNVLFLGGLGWESCNLWYGENQAVRRLREIEIAQLAFTLKMWTFTEY